MASEQGRILIPHVGEKLVYAKFLAKIRLNDGREMCKRWNRVFVSDGAFFVLLGLASKMKVRTSRAQPLN